MSEIRNSGNQYEIQDPIAQYPSPPFPQQEQTGPATRSASSRRPTTARTATSASDG
ncbi:hypothetical protein BC477_10185 [Clavibacter michiganensis subsp. michiganensis]|uniref:Uncharacterized protein n=1 Tax=Clavibacter michiganensis subsp. michiganensis TaxID=33013 RepID=A0A251XNT6_CLAMM|nr:hypothetical protein BC477_10185 [Clavibacter michiganensis subsp. michiganensis]OUE05096.1 hypothetical protein CMMCAS07_09105 [Clavibacter michiganensis subsp. michiganensis]